MLLTRLTKSVARVWCGWLEWSRTDTDGAKELENKTEQSNDADLLEAKFIIA